MCERRGKEDRHVCTQSSLILPTYTHTHTQSHSHTLSRTHTRTHTHYHHHLSFVRDWNTNAKYSDVAQVILKPTTTITHTHTLTTHNSHTHTHTHTHNSKLTRTHTYTLTTHNSHAHTHTHTHTHLSFVRDWNTNAKYSDVAQVILKHLLRTYSADELLQSRVGVD